MLNKNFEGWYFKHQDGDYMLSLIPGISSSGAFIQVIDNDGTHHYPMSNISINGDKIYCGNCIFSKNGVILDLPNINGKLAYENTTPLKSDIMGPFKHLPMQCRHGVLSMNHRIKGQLQINNKNINFDNATGYIEKDSGRSFPRSYIWMQCNDFDYPCSIMVSIAHIPFCGFSFTGCICAIIHNNKEYRFATYNGVKILKVSPNIIVLKQGHFLLEIKMTIKNKGHLLKSPKLGVMSETIRESYNAAVHIRLQYKMDEIINLQSSHAAYECML